MDATARGQTVRRGLATAWMLLLACPAAMVRAPRRWRTRGWLGAAVLLAAVVAAALEKARLHAWVPPATTADWPFGIADACGGGVGVVVFGATLLAVGALLARPAWVDAAAALGGAGATSFALTKLGQLVLAEDRPRDGGAMHFFVAFGHGVSGHASAAALLFFPLTRVLARGWPRPARVALAIALAGWIGWVAWTRMALGAHYAWNVLLGLAVGLAAGLATASEWERRRAAGTLPT